MAEKCAQNSTHEGISQIFRKRFCHALSKSTFNSWRQVAEQSKCSPSTLQSIARGTYDKSDIGPGLFVAYRAADVLGSSLDELIPPKRPKSAQFLAAYCGKETPIQAFETMLNYCDVYDKPQRGSTHLVRLGPLSLLSERSKISDPALLQVQYQRWPTSRRHKIFQRQQRAWQTGALTELELFDVPFEQTNLNVRVSFIISACRVIDFDGSPRLLIFCEPIPQKE